jgi:multicomponent Na+:H+ antiporter subunit D
MNALIVAPVAVPLLLAALALILPKRARVQRATSLLGAVAIALSAIALLRATLADGVLRSQLGGHPAPFGISFAADALSASMTLITGIIGACVAIYPLQQRRSPPVFHPLLLLLLGSVSGAFLTADLFNLYVWFELMIVSSFGLLVLGRSRQQLDGTVKYVTLNVITAGLLLLAIALLYSATGTLDFADLARHIPEAADQQVITCAAAVLLVAFGIKAALFPLFFWLPDSYHTPSVGVSALFAGLLTKVGVYALYRLFPMLFPEQLLLFQPLLCWVAALTMITGVLGAIAHSNIRRILAFHIISQIGYMLMGLALGTPLALAGGIFYIAHHILIKTNLFLIGGLMARRSGSGELARMGGLLHTAPGTAFLFAITAGSLAGVPPFSGFWAKLILVQAGISAGFGWLVAVALIVSVLTLFSMTKIWQAAFWGPLPSGARGRGRRIPGAAYAPVVALAVTSLYLGANAQWLLSVAESATAQISEQRAGVQQDQARELRQARGGAR